jgi:ABC-type nitrate/sulfonate/bicarbonate transport system ATPase subunit
MPNSHDFPAQPPIAVGLEISGLRVQFDQLPPILDQLYLHVEPGQIIALVGASGCGKSTLLRAIAGLQNYQAGSIDFSNAPNGDRRVGCAFVFQDATLLPWRTVIENVRLPFELGHRRETPAEIDQRIVTALQSVSLNQENWHKFPRQLSGGMRMRTSIARALVTDPSLLLLDEPFAALDDLLRTKLNQLLLELWSAKRRTVLFVTHNIAEAVMLSHQIAVVAGGRIARLIPNGLSWPRNIQQRTSVEFAQQYAATSQALNEESG